MRMYHNFVWIAFVMKWVALHCHTDIVGGKSGFVIGPGYPRSMYTDSILEVMKCLFFLQIPGDCAEQVVNKHSVLWHKIALGVFDCAVGCVKLLADGARVVGVAVSRE